MNYWTTFTRGLRVLQLTLILLAIDRVKNHANTSHKPTYVKSYRINTSTHMLNLI